MEKQPLKVEKYPCNMIQIIPNSKTSRLVYFNSKEQIYEPASNQW